MISIEIEKQRNREKGKQRKRETVKQGDRGCGWASENRRYRRVLAPAIAI
jgi:hypothetical protein